MTAPTLSALDRFKAAASDNLAALSDEKLVEVYAMARTLHASRTGDARAEALLPMLALGDMIAAKFGDDYMDALMEAIDEGRTPPPLAWTPDTARARIGGTFGT